MKGIWSKEALEAMTNDVKESVHREKIPPGGRPLTAGEVEMLKKLFEKSIDYKFVRIHKDKFLPGIQGDDVSMTPWGEIYMPPQNYREDFSISLKNKDHISVHHFIHEIAHVWQFHRKDFVFFRGTVLSCGTGIAQAIESLSEHSPEILKPALESIQADIDPYTYRSNNKTKDFFSYSLESQAEILADFYMQEILGKPDYYGKRLNKKSPGHFNYKKCLENFLEEVDRSNRRPRDLTKEWELKQ